MMEVPSSKLDNPDKEQVIEESDIQHDKSEQEVPDNERPVINEEVYYPEYRQTGPWSLVCSAKKEFEISVKEGFLKGCKWSPDGTCLLTCSDDDVLRFFDLPADLYNSHKRTYQGCNTADWTPSLRIKEGEIVYDYCWYPLMSSWNAETCLVASTAKGGPIHFWDAYKGTLAATYRAYNYVDEVEPAKSLCISPDGEKLYCGFDKCVRVFDVKVPGRNCQTRLTKSTDGYSAGQTGIISCIAVNPALHSVYAAGSYMKTIGLYSEPDGAALCVLEGHRGGVTHLKFSPDGLVLYSGGRKDAEILCWDLRNPGHVLFTMNRSVSTNQRIYFDLDPSGRYLLSGDTNGCVTMWDTQSGLQISRNASESLPVLPELMRLRDSADCTNGVSCHPWLPVIATSSGQRHVTLASESSDSESDNEPKVRENSVKLWWAGLINAKEVKLNQQACRNNRLKDGLTNDGWAHEQRHY